PPFGQRCFRGAMADLGKKYALAANCTPKFPEAMMSVAAPMRLRLKSRRQSQQEPHRKPSPNPDTGPLRCP
ncbi:MAG: hypothetical protein AAFY13_13780, partial [Pseudomonadota bacterium]